MRLRLRLSPLVIAALAVAGCSTVDDFFGAPEGPPLPGERVSVLRISNTLTADPEIADLRVRLPRPVENANWAQSGGNSAHAMHHIAVPDALNVAWSASVGEQASDTQRLLAEPVIADGRVYTIDAASQVSAFDAGNGGLIWRVDLTPEEEDDDLFGGGLAVAEGRVFVSTPFAKVVALDAGSGAVIWESSVAGPMRAAPAVSDGRVFVVTIDNQLQVLATDDGRKLWSHVAISESAGLLGGAAPAVAGSTVVVAYTSGELYALRVETGGVLWSDSFTGASRGDALARLADIRGRPVIDRDLAIAINNSGLLAAIDLRRGGRAWDIDIGGIQSPWVAGDFVYVVANTGEIVCLTRRDGRIRWVQSLPAYEDPAERERPIYWSGPVLAGDRLIVTGSNGQALSVSPYTGDILGQIALPARTHLPPTVASGTVYILSDDAELIALR